MALSGHMFGSDARNLEMKIPPAPRQLCLKLQEMVSLESSVRLLTDAKHINNLFRESRS